MSQLKNRVAALEKALREVRRRQATTPYEELDPLSRSLVDAANELADLDEQGKAALLEELNRGGADMSMANLEQMIRSITVSY